MSQTLEKVQDVIVYRNERSYSHNAVVERLPDGELIAVVQEQVRRKYRTHADASSIAILVRSRDGGLTWDPRTRTVVVASENEAINDPAIKRLRDGTLLVDFFKWRFGTDDVLPTGHRWVRTLDGVHYAWMAGSYTMRSVDAGITWEAPMKVAAPTGDDTAVSDPVLELPDGTLLIPLYAAYPGDSERVVVMRSTDGGQTWGEPATVAYDPLGYYQFQEPSLLYLPSGKLICMIRVQRAVEQEYGYYLYQSDSADLGKTWSPPRRTSMWGHPPHLLLLQSGVILCVYGYRRPPYGIRACLSHDGGQTWDLENELILRADGIDRDLGYPTSIQRDDGMIFTIWYMCEADARTTAMGGEGFFAHDNPLGYVGGTLYREK